LETFGLVVVKEDNIKETINKNDLVVIQRNIKELKENDIIAINKNNQTTVSRIYQIDNNEIIFIKGDNNLYPNNEILEKQNIEGKMIFRLPLIGGFVSFLQTKIMTVIIIVLLVFEFKINKELKRRRKKLVLSIDKEEKS